MLCFAAGAGAFFFATAVGWNSFLFRLFYLFGGVLTVPVLALGTCYLLGSRRLADRLALGVALLGAFSAGVVLTAPLRIPLADDRLNEGREVFGVLPRVLAAGGSALGAAVVIIGALWSAIRLLRHGRGMAASRRLAGSNALIALGTVVISAKGPFVALTGSDEIGFAVALASGLAVMFGGFLVAASRPGRPAAAVGGRAPAALRAS